jgi:hypothetical protein
MANLLRLSSFQLLDGLRVVGRSSPKEDSGLRRAYFNREASSQCNSRSGGRLVSRASALDNQNGTLNCPWLFVQFTRDATP